MHRHMGCTTRAHLNLNCNSDADALTPPTVFVSSRAQMYWIYDAGAEGEAELIAEFEGDFRGFIATACRSVAPSDSESSVHGGQAPAPASRL